MTSLWSGLLTGPLARPKVSGERRARRPSVKNEWCTTCGPRSPREPTCYEQQPNEISPFSAPSRQVRMTRRCARKFETGACESLNRQASRWASSSSMFSGKFCLFSKSSWCARIGGEVGLVRMRFDRGRAKWPRVPFGGPSFRRRRTKRHRYFGAASAIETVAPSRSRTGLLSYSCTAILGTGTSNKSSPLMSFG